MIPTKSIGWMRDGEALLARTIDAAVPLDAPSLLAGWDRATLVSHLANNAVALVNLVRWAATGVETPMYATAQTRDDDIAKWRSADAVALLGHVGHTRQALDEAVSTLPDSAWDHEVRTNSGRIVKASAVPWMRAREVYIHAVDLNAGTSIADVPADIRTALVDEVVQLLSGKPDCPVLDLRAGERHWQLGGAADSEADGRPIAGSDLDGRRIEGADTTLLAWLIGRSGGECLSSAGPLPVLPRWL